MEVNHTKKNIKRIIVLLLILKLVFVLLIPKQIIRCNEKAKVLNINAYSLKGHHYYIWIKTLDSNKEFKFCTTKQEYDRLNVNDIIDINYLSVIFSYGETDGNVEIN